MPDGIQELFKQMMDNARRTPYALRMKGFDEIMRLQDYAGNQYANAYGTPAMPPSNENHSNGLSDMMRGKFGGADSLASKWAQASGMGLAAFGATNVLPALAIHTAMSPGISMPVDIAETIAKAKDFPDKAKVLEKLLGGDNLASAIPRRIMSRLGETNTVSKILEQFIGHLPR